MYYCTSYKILQQERRYSSGMKSQNCDMVDLMTLFFPQVVGFIYSALL